MLARAEVKWLNKQNINLNLVTQWIWLHRLFVKEGWTLKPRTIYKSINLGTPKREENWPGSKKTVMSSPSLFADIVTP